MDQKKKPICFIIMPFTVREHDLVKYNNDSEHWDQVYCGLIIPAIEQAGLIPQRDDDDYSMRLITEGIVTKIEQADIILCDMSSHNPNVHLELGWALRANKKIVLIKDDITAFNFDLNQFYTSQYYSTLQPRELNQSVVDLSKVIKNQRTNFPLRNNNYNSLNVKRFSDLQTEITGTTWRKRNGLEEIFFVSSQVFVYSSVGQQKWLENDVSFNTESDFMQLRWKHDNYVSTCKFDFNFSQFSEQDGVTWFLISKEPFIHYSFKTRKS